MLIRSCRTENQKIVPDNDSVARHTDTQAHEYRQRQTQGCARFADFFLKI